MTVKELKQRLQVFPDDMPVAFREQDGYFDFSPVRQAVQEKIIPLEGGYKEPYGDAVGNFVDVCVLRA